MPRNISANYNPVQIRPTALVAAASDNPTIYIYDEIGQSDWYPAVGAKDVIAALSSIGRVAAIDVRINSPGGDVFEGEAIYNALLRNQAKINVFIDGLAASAASFIAMAGDSIEIAENAFLMIHNSWIYAMGNKADLTKTVDLLGKVDANLAAIYATRSGIDVAKITEMMDAETWFTAKEALDNKLATKIGQNLKTPGETAAKAVARFAKAPSSLKQLAAKQRDAEAKAASESKTPKLDKLKHFLSKTK